LEQERMICTYLQERAKICSGFFLRPQLHCSLFLEFNSKLPWILASVAALIISGAWGSIVHWTMVAGTSAWVPAILIVISVVLIQSLLRDSLTSGWHDNFLWICHEVNVDESMFLHASNHSVERNLVHHQGRITQIKRYVHDQSTKMEVGQSSCQKLVQSMNVKSTTTENTLKHNGENIDRLASAIGDIAKARKDGVVGRTTTKKFAHDRSARDVLGLTDRPQDEDVDRKDTDSEGATELDSTVSYLQFEGFADELHTEVAQVRLCVDELRTQMWEQNVSQLRLEQVAQGIAESLKEVRSIAHRRRVDRKVVPPVGHSTLQLTDGRPSVEEAGAAEGTEVALGSCTVPAAVGLT